MDQRQSDRSVGPDALFLQLLLAAGFVSEPSLRANFANLNRRLAPESRRTLEDVRENAENVLGALGMDLATLRNDFDGGTVYYAVVQREPMPAFLNRVVYTPSHAVQLKELLDRMLTSSRCDGVPFASLTVTQFPAKHEIVNALLAEHRLVILNPSEALESTDPSADRAPSTDRSAANTDPANTDPASTDPVSAGSASADPVNAASTDSANAASTDPVSGPNARGPVHAVPRLADDSRIFIGARLLCEIEPFLASAYGERTLFRCLGCETWLLKGRLCANEACPARLHDRCYAAYFSSHGARPGECPLCSSPL